ncbi:5'-3' exoribonuclease 1 [Teratosphaeria destructans]|uniref:5'-3' exoribonuclease 1 n=1 Tax=Teratosphaeria destructans TaxID=418781 RepID=A0A9W7ST09_9PEZI|nr:5'-3' exoribonuclease 1 [Teratosphaeria destructans]
MQFTIALTTTLLSACALAIPTTTTPLGDDTLTYQIHDFTERKYNGVNISTLFFDVVSAPSSNAHVNFQCAPYNPAVTIPAPTFEAGHVYFCAKDSPYSFSFVPGDVKTGAKAVLNLWQTVSEFKTYVGEVDFPEPDGCRTAGPGADTVCEAQGDYEIVLNPAGSSGQ